ncbi:MAG: DUF2807 domain-containing protein [Bacteroidales bacterium]|jgi:predicted small secreted protein|nr:DUF2807 domain-containing protein [Bacteroidales bacterium]
MKKTFYIPIIIIITSLLTSACYRLTNKVVGYGNSFETERNVDIRNVKEINVNGSIDVEIFYSEDSRVIITAQENITNLISVNVMGDIAKVDYKPNVNVKTTDITKVTFYMPDIQNITVNGSGDVFYGGRFPTLSKMELKVNGSGDIKASEICCNILNINIYGSGDIKTGEILCNELNTNIRGSGDIELEYIDCYKINTSVNGSGDVEYSGYCDEHIIRINGSGKIESYDLQSLFTQVDVMGSGNSYIWVIDALNVYINGSGNVYYRGNPDVSVHSRGSGKVIHRP